MASAWTIEQVGFDRSELGKYETVFALGNGHLGIRGVLDDGRSLYKIGTFINGFYDTEPITYGEKAYGYATHHQRMINITNGVEIDLWVGDEPFDLGTGKVNELRRSLDLSTGCLTAHYDWTSPSGCRMLLETRRVVPMTRRATLAIQWKLTLPEQGATITLLSGLQAPSQPETDGHDPRVGTVLAKSPLMAPKIECDNERLTLGHTIRSTRFRLMAACSHKLTTDARVARTHERSVGSPRHRFTIEAQAGQAIALEKYVVYEHTHDLRRVKLGALAKRALTNAGNVAFDGLASEQREYLRGFWEIGDVRIDGAAGVQEAVRFNLYHILQAAGHDGRTNIGAKGLTGEGYEGHYFWDTEIYALPIFTYLLPEVARRLVEYRHSILPHARARASELHHRGALFPWRTINGEEASAYFPAGTAQYHINADIAYAARRYALATGDTDSLYGMVAEIALETARFWVSLGSHVPGRGFCINGVTGPDEYTALVNNNVYTNLMAADNLRFAVELARSMPLVSPTRWADLRLAMELHDDEVLAWERAAAEMVIPFDERTGLYPQDDSFFSKAVWDFDGTPRSMYPLLLHFHPLTIYRYQVLKQPDLVLALFLQSNRFTLQEKRRNFLYYDKLTTGDSSLAACVQSIVAAEVGEMELAESYFHKTVRMDLDDINGNVKDGVHTANMAGTWLSVVYGFVGFRDTRGSLSFWPRLPSAWTRVEFALRVRGGIVRVEVEREQTTYLWQGPGYQRVRHCGRDFELEPGIPVSNPNRILTDELAHDRT